MPRGPRPKPILDRILSKVEKRDSGCWEFCGFRDSKGYGKISAKCYGRPSMNAHRASWIAHKGPVPDGMFVCHKCDNPCCVNPDHLFVGTCKDNVRDMWDKGRAVVNHDNLHRGHNRFAAKLTPDQVRLMREMAEAGSAPKELAEEFKTHVVNVRLILRRKTWKEV